MDNINLFSSYYAVNYDAGKKALLKTTILSNSELILSWNNKVICTIVFVEYNVIDFLPYNARPKKLYINKTTEKDVFFTIQAIFNNYIKAVQ